MIGRIVAGALVVAIVVISMRVVREDKVKAIRARVDAEDAAKEAQFAHGLMESTRKWRRIAGYIFLLITGGAGLAFLAVISGGGAGPDRMFDGLVLVPILIVGAIGGIISGVVLLGTSLRLQSLKAEHAIWSAAKKEPNQASEPTAPSGRGSP